MRCLIDRRMTVYDDLGVRFRIFVKLIANPQQVFLVLPGQRDAGANARMTEEQRIGLVAQVQPFQELQMRLWNRLARRFVDGQHPVP